MLGARTWQPITLTSEGPAQPSWTVDCIAAWVAQKPPLKRSAPRPRYVTAFPRGNDWARNRQTV